jgi:hypothetical protein
MGFVLSRVGGTMVRTTTRETYCPECDDHREIKKTVPWQADLCTSCGSDVGD